MIMDPQPWTMDKHQEVEVGLYHIKVLSEAYIFAITKINKESTLAIMSLFKVQILTLDMVIFEIKDVVKNKTYTDVALPL